QALLPELKSGKLAAHWTAYQKANAAQAKASTPPEAKPGKPVRLTVEELKQKLRERRERFKSLLVEYDTVVEAHFEPMQMVNWYTLTIRDYQERQRFAFAGAKRFAQVLRPGVAIKNVPQDQIVLDPGAPPEITKPVEAMREIAADRKD